jgi:hypothetical protein
MSELKYQLMLNKDMSWVPRYLKSEADKFIADLEESHKKEVGQLLIEIAELKETLNNSRNARKYWRKEYLIEYKEILHQKHKRCLAMAKWCERKRVDAANYRIPREKWEFYEKWHNRWLAIAKKFKEEA